MPNPRRSLVLRPPEEDRLVIEKVAETLGVPLAAVGEMLLHSAIDRLCAVAAEQHVEPLTRCIPAVREPLRKPWAILKLELNWKGTRDEYRRHQQKIGQPASV